jgi:hypothetical protein
VERGGSEAGSCSLVKPEGELRRVVHGVWGKLTSMWKADVSFFSYLPLEKPVTDDAYIFAKPDIC